jgi:hypothetical protein
MCKSWFLIIYIMLNRFFGYCPVGHVFYATQFPKLLLLSCLDEIGRENFFNTVVRNSRSLRKNECYQTVRHYEVVYVHIAKGTKNLLQNFCRKLPCTSPVRSSNYGRYSHDGISTVMIVGAWNRLTTVSND